MNWPEFDPWVRAGVFAIMVCFLAVRAGTLLQWMTRRHEGSGHRLAHVLRAELTNLLDAYELNLKLIADDVGYVISTKAMSPIYRANLTRITRLPPPVIAAVVAAYARNDRIEALINARSPTSHGNRRHAPAPLSEMFQQEYLAGCSLILTALAALTPKPPASPDSVQAADQRDHQPAALPQA